jgi:hypothetical protein
MAPEIEIETERERERERERGGDAFIYYIVELI